MATDTADVVVVGAGVVGASVTYHLTRRRPGLRVVLVERATVAAGATGRSTAIVRTHYVDRTEAQLARRSLHWFTHWSEAVGGECGYRQVGFLMVVPPQHVDLMGRTVPMLQDLGVDVRMLGPAELTEVDPRLSAEGVGAAAYEPVGGYADPAGTAAALVKSARTGGAELRQQVTVQAVRVTGARVTGVVTSAGEISCGAVVVAAGAGSPELLASAGIALPLEVRLIRAAALERAAGSRPHPAVIDRVFDTNFRPEGGLTVFGIHPNVAVDGAGVPPAVEESVVREAALRPAARMPELATASIRPGWAQLDGYTPDGHPVVGPAPGVDGLYLAVGASGTGFKTAPALGESLAGIVLGDRHPDDVPVGPLSAERFAAGQLLASNYEH